MVTKFCHLRMLHFVFFPFLRVENPQISKRTVRSLWTIGLIMISFKFSLHLHFIATSLNNRRQLNENDLQPNSFFKLVQKILVGNYESIMGICEKIFIINLHNLQMLLMLWIKYKFSECLAPLHKHEGLQWKTFWRRFCSSPQIRGAVTRKSFCAPQKFVVLREFVLNIWKKFSPKNIVFPQTLKPGYRLGFAKIVSVIRIFCCEGHSVSRCGITSKTFFINHH